MTTNWHYHNDWASTGLDPDRQTQNEDLRYRGESDWASFSEREARRLQGLPLALPNWNFDDTPASDTPSKSNPSTRWPTADGSTTADKGKAMSNTSNLFGNMPGANKFMDRLFKKAEGIVWDLMSGRVGIQTKDGIATLEGEGDDAQINVNLLDQFGMGIPAFAQSTPVAGVNVGDIIFFGSSDRPGWVIEKKVPADAAKQLKFVLMKVDGTRSTWTPPKVSMLGMDSGVMVLRSLMSMLPGGNAGLQGMQSMLMPMMMMGQMNGGDSDGGMDMEAMIPMMLMGQMQAQPVTAADGTVVAAPNPMAQMMPMMMMMGMMKKMNGGGNGNSNSGNGGKRSPFN